MIQQRLIGASFLLAMTASLACLPPSPPRGTEMRSLLHDLVPGEAVHPPNSSGLWQFLTGLASSHESSERCSSASLKTLSQAEADFRGCDRDWNKVVEFPTKVPKPLEPDNARANDRDWCNVVDFPSDYLDGLTPDPHGTIQLIELSVASADVEDP